MPTNIVDYRSNEQGITNDVCFVITDDKGDITGYIYKSSDTEINASLNDTQLQQITSSNETEPPIINESVTDLSFVNASLIVLIVSNFALFGALAVQILLRSLHGRD